MSDEEWKGTEGNCVVKAIEESIVNRETGIMRVTFCLQAEL